MKIKEIIKRECCQARDLKTLLGPGAITAAITDAEFKFCQHCGRHHRYRKHGEAGADDWGYYPEPWPWEKRVIPQRNGYDLDMKNLLRHYKRSQKSQNHDR